VNWYGASEDLGIPAGLDRTPRSTLAKLIAGQGFNCVRFPFSVWMTEQTAPVPDQYLAANSDLYGSTPIKVYDACVRALADEGLIVIPTLPPARLRLVLLWRRHQRPVVQRPLGSREIHCGPRRFLTPAFAGRCVGYCTRNRRQRRAAVIKVGRVRGGMHAWEPAASGRRS
jgi:hypothetical protein